MSISSLLESNSYQLYAQSLTNISGTSIPNIDLTTTTSSYLSGSTITDNTINGGTSPIFTLTLPIGTSGTKNFLVVVYALLRTISGTQSGAFGFQGTTFLMSYASGITS